MANTRAARPVDPMTVFGTSSLRPEADPYPVSASRTPEPDEPSPHVSSSSPAAEPATTQRSRPRVQGSARGIGRDRAPWEAAMSLRNHGGEALRLVYLAMVDMSAEEARQARRARASSMTKVDFEVEFRAALERFGSDRRLLQKLKQSVADSGASADRIYDAQVLVSHLTRLASGMTASEAKLADARSIDPDPPVVATMARNIDDYEQFPDFFDRVFDEALRAFPGRTAPDVEALRAVYEDLESRMRAGVGRLTAVSRTPAGGGPQSSGFVYFLYSVAVDRHLPGIAAMVEALHDYEGGRPILMFGGRKAEHEGDVALLRAAYEDLALSIAADLEDPSVSDEARDVYAGQVKDLAKQMRADLASSADPSEDFYELFEEYSPGGHSPGHPAFHNDDAVVLTCDVSDVREILESRGLPVASWMGAPSVRRLESWRRKRAQVEEILYMAVRSDVRAELVRMGVMD